MSQQPEWITAQGSLGTIPESIFFKLLLEAIDLDSPSDVTYTLIAGALPAGIAVNRNGVIEGIPETVVNVKGVPSIVSENITSKFTVRATAVSGRIADRTFLLTISGQDVPQFITPSGVVGNFFDGEQVNISIDVADSDPNDTITVEQIGGELPPGLSLSTSGVISGYIEPIPTANSALVNFDIANWDTNLYDFSNRTINKNYQFTLLATDGKEVDIRVFEIAVISRDSLTADTILYSADSTIFTSDVMAIRQPFLLEYTPDFGQIRHDNFFAYQFIGTDPNNGEITYTLTAGNLPNSLSLNSTTGWLSGYIDAVNLQEIEYNFTIQLVNHPSEVSSIPYNFKFTVVGNVETEVQWISTTNLGEINNGEISTFSIEARHKDTAIALQYRLQSGLYNKLPQGLHLLNSGNIVGRTSFKTFSFDNGDTTIDSVFSTRRSNDETTFDRIFTFNVEAFSSSGFISVTKEFNILLTKFTNGPYNTLYAKALLPEADREIVIELINDLEIMIPDIIYRPDDLNFGIPQNMIYAHAYGLEPATIAEYFNALEINHYRKTLSIGEIKTARALDANGDILYEVVYAVIVDDQINAAGESISKIVDLNDDVINNGNGAALPLGISQVYPNSIPNMQAQVIDSIGQTSKILPNWMLSKQSDGKVLGFVPAWVIAYTKPNQAELMAYRIKHNFAGNLNRIDFELDRFTLDARLSKDWVLCENDESSITADNKTTLTVDTINITADKQNPSYNCSPTWANNLMTTFDRVAVETTLDLGSCRFVSPVDVFDAGPVIDQFDQYIMFPQYNIIK